MKRTIYIVEDNRFVREVLALLIEEEPDLEVCGIAETADEALDAILNVSPDLVLTDLSLPGMNGIELIERLQILKPRQRVIMLSGHTEPFYREQAVAAGANGYIPKGDAMAMIEGIRQVLAGETYVMQHPVISGS